MQFSEIIDSLTWPLYCRPRVINQTITGLPAKHWPGKMIILVSDFLGCLKENVSSVFCSNLEVSFDLVPTDILGSEDLHPKHLLYHVPKYLRGVDKNERHFQVNWQVRSILNCQYLLKYIDLLPADFNLLFTLFRFNCVVKRLWSTPSSLKLTLPSGKDGGLRWVDPFQKFKQPRWSLWEILELYPSKQGSVPIQFAFRLCKITGGWIVGWTRIGETEFWIVSTWIKIR